MADPLVGRRGTTTVPDRVVAKLASQVALDTDGVVRRAGRGLPGTNRRPATTAVVSGDLARITIDVALAYPAPLAAVTAAVRERIMVEVSRSVGLEVRQVDITVGALVVATHEERRVS